MIIYYIMVYYIREALDENYYCLWLLLSMTYLLQHAFIITCYITTTKFLCLYSTHSFYDDEIHVFASFL